ncbi:MAG: sugar phosphate nucleotidyltransferase [Candidatus Aenigmatarchaeota archaeon]
MKGVILAGGKGTRLNPLTRVTNKHLLPLYNKPMIFCPIETFVKAGIKKILIVTGGEDIGDFMQLLGSGKEFGVDLTYKVQDEAGGIAQAIQLAKDFVGEGKFAVILGDNVFEDDIKDYVKEFEGSGSGAMVFLKEVDDAQRFGVAEIDGGSIVGIEEKPKNPKSNLAVTGLYMYDSKVFEIIKTLRPSARGELEISDVNSSYVKSGSLSYKILSGFWSDAGTFESLHRATGFVKKSSV